MWSGQLGTRLSLSSNEEPSSISLSSSLRRASMAEKDVCRFIKDGEKESVVYDEVMKINTGLETSSFNPAQALKETYL